MYVVEVYLTCIGKPSPSVLKNLTEDIDSYLAAITQRYSVVSLTSVPMTKKGRKWTMVLDISNRKEAEEAHILYTRHILPKLDTLSEGRTDGIKIIGHSNF